MDWAVWPFLLLSILAFESCKGCQVEQCTQVFGMSLEDAKIAEPEPTSTYCEILKTYGQCIHRTAKSCHGELNYHSANSIHSKLNDRYCSGRRNGSHPSRKNQSRTTTTEATNTRAPISCAYHGKNRFHYCSLFGDPHLKTYKHEYQTCEILGAWPLIDNPYFAVQVTNEKVQEGYLGTATTKITIIIKGSSTPCTSEKTYEAQSDTPSLPTTFTDGTTAGGMDSTVVLNFDESPDSTSSSPYAHQKVEIYIRYIETILVVRKVGRYLAFSARIPQEVTKYSINSETNELCSRGCPKKERLSTAHRGQFVSREAALEKCKNTKLTNDITNTLTDNYLDWCIFDVMTAGLNAADEFVVAAHSAQADVLRFEPQSLKNRTTLLDMETDNVQYSSASPLLRIHLLTFAFIFAILFITSRNSSFVNC